MVLHPTTEAAPFVRLEAARDAATFGAKAASQAALAAEGLPVPAGVVITDRFRREFLTATGLDEHDAAGIRGDFNPRNVGFRRDAAGPVLVAYDWELATVDVPQRDLVELLAFVGPADPDRWMETHRVALERESGIPLDREAWARDAARARHALLVTRLTAYHVIHRARRQRFLPRTVRNLVRQMNDTLDA
jgi:hypothetical protein